jgi:O-antigen/teichoic acid export membrane protein
LSTLTSNLLLIPFTLLYWAYFINSENKISPIHLVAIAIINNLSGSLALIVAVDFSRYHYIIWNTGQAIILLLALYFSHYLKYDDIDAILKCYIVAGIYQITYFVLTYRKIIFSKKNLGPILPSVGLKAYLFSIGKEFIYRLDLIILPNLITPKEFGQYSIVQNLAQMSWRVTDPLILMEMRKGVKSVNGRTNNLNLPKLILATLFLCVSYIFTLEIIFKLMLEIELDSGVILTSIYMVIISLMAIWRSFISQAMISGYYETVLKIIAIYSILYLCVSFSINNLLGAMMLHGLSVALLIVFTLRNYNTKNVD